LRSPKKFLICLAQETAVLRSSARTDIKLLMHSMLAHFAKVEASKIQSGEYTEININVINVVEISM
jgi:hypothetical protein